MRDFIQDYFTLSKQDRYGLLLLISLFFMVLILPSFVSHFEENEVSDFTEFRAEIADALILLETEKEEKYDFKKAKRTEVDPANLFTFNPNELTKEQALKLGLSKFAANNLTKYLAKGGRIYRKEDFSKIHGIEEYDYERLKTYIKIPETKKPTYNKKKSFKKEYEKPTIELTPFAFDPNTLTATTAKELGLPNKIGERLEKYLGTGARFKAKEDFKKMYGVTDEMYETLEPYITIKETKIEEPKIEEKIPIELANFNPNELTTEKALKLGLSKKVGKGIENYLKTGARFKAKEDFKKIYGIESEDFERLEAYITIPEAEKPKPVRIDINTAGIEDWRKISGIGNYFATEIVKYRESLGGFTSLDQLKEVYKMDEKFDLIQESLAFENKAIRKINLNTVEVEELRDHPYLDFNTANSIVKLRLQYGGYYVSIDQIKKSFLVDDELFEKLAPYLILMD